MKKHEPSDYVIYFHIYSEHVTNVDVRHISATSLQPGWLVFQLGSQRTAKSLILTNVNSATKRLVSPAKRILRFCAFVWWQKFRKTTTKTHKFWGVDFLSMRLFVVNWIINILVVVSCFGCLHKKWRATFCTSETLLPKIFCDKKAVVKPLYGEVKTMLEISGKPQANSSTYWSSWWFQPIWNILVKLDHFPR